MWPLIFLSNQVESWLRSLGISSTLNSRIPKILNMKPNRFLAGVR
jgi:hypothetical protein